MGHAFLLTGHPGCGKTTLIRNVIERLPFPAGGFYTLEIRPSGVRQGFEIVTLDGRRGTLAHTSTQSPVKVGKYGVDLSALEGLAIAAIHQAIHAGALVVIDEIGPMEIASPRFCQAVLAALESPPPVLGTIVQRSLPFSDKIKRRPGVSLVDVTPANRDHLPDRLLADLNAIIRFAPPASARSHE